MSDLEPITEEKPKAKRGAKTTRQQAHTNKARPRRISMSEGFKLDVPEWCKADKDFYYRWIADRDGRVQRAKQAAYEPVKDPDTGENIVVFHNVNMHLMKLPAEFRVEDVALKNKKIVDTLKAEQKLKDGEYIPDGRKAPLQRDSDLLDPLA